MPYGGTVDVSGLVVTNAGKFAAIAYYQSAVFTTSAGTSITCTSTSAFAFAHGTTAFDGKIVTLESDPPTLPSVEDVASGTVYGYDGIELTGTGIINDPAAIAAAMITSFGSLPEVLVKTTIATLASQTSFTLTAGSADNDAYNGQTVIVTDASTSAQKAVGVVLDYVGSTKTVTLSADPAIFTMAVGDSVCVIAGASSGGGGGDTAGVTELLTRIPDATPGAEGGLPVLSAGLTVTAVLDSAARVKLDATQPDYAPLKSSDYTAPLTAADTRTALGMSAADLDTQFDAILAAASAGAGTGARLVTITVNDGTTVLQNAVVRLTEGGNTYRALTNVSGVATFNVDDATYSVAISKVGYSYAGTTIVVDGVETATYSMTAINVTPGSGDLTTGYLTCLDELGAAEADVSVRCQVVQVPSSGTGFAYDSTVQVETSAANGLVEFPMVKGCRYLIWRGSIKPPAGIVPVLISASAGSTTALGSLIGD
jgi:hypothetical protein